jgi:hypothetical protein
MAIHFNTEIIGWLVTKLCLLITHLLRNFDKRASFSYTVSKLNFVKFCLKRKKISRHFEKEIIGQTSLEMSLIVIQCKGMHQENFLGSFLLWTALNQIFGFWGNLKTKWKKNLLGYHVYCLYQYLSFLSRVMWKKAMNVCNVILVGPGIIEVVAYLPGL